MMSSEASEIVIPSSGAGSADVIHALVHFARLIRHRKTYVFATLVVATLLGTLYYLTADRIYQASATLLVTQTGADPDNVGMSSDSGRDALIPTYERLFSSAVVVDRALEQLAAMPAELRIDFTGKPRDKWRDMLRNNLSANAIRRTSLIELSVRSKSPQAATAIVSAIVRSYLDFMDQNHKDVSVEVVNILDLERKQIEKQLSQKQLDLLHMQHQVRDLGLREGSNIVHPIVQRVVRLNELLVKAQEQRVQLRASLATIRQAVQTGGDLRQHLLNVEPIVGRELVMGALGLNPQQAQNIYQMEKKLLEDGARLKTVMEHLGPNHPEVRELSASIQDTQQYLMASEVRVQRRLNEIHNGQLGSMLLAMVEQKLIEVQAEEAELQQQYVQSETEAVGLNNQMAELQLVVNEIDRLRNLHETLLTQISKIDIRQNQADVRVAVVSEPAASDRPVSPKLSLLVLLVLLGGTGSGAAIVYVLDLLDDRFRSPDELREQLGVSVLAMVRDLPESSETGADAVLSHVASDSPDCEPFRTLRTTLAFCGEELNRISITSTQPGDGKTTMLANLAATYAQAGKRTLLIDADMRRPGLSKLFAMRGAGGLSRLLAAEETSAAYFQQEIRPTGIDRLDILPSGYRPLDPSELLSRPRMQELLAWAEGTYDQVLIDCPPVLVGADALIVGRMADGVVMVIQPAKNPRRAVIKATADLQSMRVNLLGIVANRIGNDGNGSQYGYGYGYEYGYGYGEDEDHLPEEQDQEFPARAA